MPSQLSDTSGKLSDLSDKIKSLESKLGEVVQASEQEKILEKNMILP